MSVYSKTLSGFSAIGVSIYHGARENGNGKLRDVCSQAPRTLFHDSGFVGKRTGYEIMMYLRLRGRMG